MLQKIKNIGENSLRRKNFPVMLGKLLTRITEKADDGVKIWCAQNAENYEEFAKSLDQEIWNETIAACKTIKKNAQGKLSQIDMDLGGGGNYLLLYFFTRYIKAKTVVETGVAAGWSSQAILTALKKNGAGQLYSSDFPYFRYANPEELIGYVVDENLKENWHLFIDGDQNNLPEIAQAVEKIDLFHYDSDKSQKGRAFAYKTLEDKLHADTIIIFDDIQDNAHFRDFVIKQKRSYKIFEFEGKYVGLIAPFV